MGMTTSRQAPPEPPAQSVYWRRRFIALIAGVSVLAIITWAFAGALRGTAPAGDAAATTTVSERPPSVAAAAASQPAAPAGQSDLAASQSAAGVSQSAAAASPSPSPGAASRAAAMPGGKTPAVARHPPRACLPGDVVLSLFASQASYPAGQAPAFVVDVVSTGKHSCAFNVGSRHLRLQISDGTAKVWTSAGCPEGKASLVTRLHRGIPVAVPVSWNGQPSSAGCAGSAAPPVAGTYTAVATDGSGTSNTLTFVIG